MKRQMFVWLIMTIVVVLVVISGSAQKTVTVE
jgi:hypothetical protein